MAEVTPVDKTSDPLNRDNFAFMVLGEKRYNSLCYRAYLFNCPYNRCHYRTYGNYSMF